MRVFDLRDIERLQWRQQLTLKDKLPVKCLILQHGSGFLMTGGELLIGLKRTRLKEALYYDYSEKKEIRLSPMQRIRSSHFGLVALKDALKCSYCLGGYEGEQHHTTSSCESFEHTRSRYWKMLPSMLSRRACAAACSFSDEAGSSLYVLGGVSEGSPLDSIERLVNSAWSLVPIKLASPLFKHAAT